MSRRLRGSGAAERQFLLQVPIGYKYYLESRSMLQFRASSEDKVDGNSCTYWCHLRCLPQGFSTEEDSYLGFCVFLVKKADLKKISLSTLLGRALFSLFFVTKGHYLLNILVKKYTGHILFFYFSYIF